VNASSQWQKAEFCKLLKNPKPPLSICIRDFLLGILGKEGYQGPIFWSEIPMGMFEHAMFEMGMLKMPC